MFNLCLKQLYSLISARLPMLSRLIKKMIRYCVEITVLFPCYLFFGKILEKLIYKTMYTLPGNNLIYNPKFDFRAKNSTNHVLISITEFIKKKSRCG